MTLETAKRIKEEGLLKSKEADAVLRGGMTICENMKDGSRKYVWIKVMPTMTDAESSIDAAMECYRKRYYKKPPKIVAESNQQDNNTPKPETTKLPKEDEIQAPQSSFIESLKKKLKEIWKEIDSLVIE